MSKKTNDKRLYFVAQAINRGLSKSSFLANEWYCQNKVSALDSEESLRRFEQFMRDARDCA